MPDIYFSYPWDIVGNKQVQDAYRKILLLLGTKEKQAEAMKLIFAHHPAEMIPAGKNHDASSWNRRFLGTKWMNAWLEDDENLVIESAWDAPFAFFQHLYAYLWNIDPYVHLRVSFYGNDEGLAHWIYGDQFIKRCDHSQSNIDAIRDSFDLNMEWREWAADEVHDLILEQYKQTKGDFQLHNFRFQHEVHPQKVHWKIEHTTDPSLNFTMRYDLRADPKAYDGPPGGIYEDHQYDGPGGEYLENHPQIWNLFQAFQRPVPKPKVLPLKEEYVLTYTPLSQEVLEKMKKDPITTAKESAHSFLTLLIEEQYLHLNEPESLSDLVTQIFVFFTDDIVQPEQTAKAIFDAILSNDSGNNLSISETELSDYLLQW
ncbi:MAG: hypothetical protein VX278_20965 [Myxococcota bacterium]|nr:hypothetical protein [Myxococcota bacterium]